MSAFKRNLVPLVCIAFVAASAATGIFYGLMGSRLRAVTAGGPPPAVMHVASQPIHPQAPREAAGKENGPRAGMRAISVRATDSSGVLALVRAGDRVDIQAVSAGQGSGLRLRTILQDVEVLVAPPPDAARTSSAAVVTLLAAPADAERLGLADAACKLRLVLRNPQDQGASPANVLTLRALFADSSQRSKGCPALLAAAGRRACSP